MAAKEAIFHKYEGCGNDYLVIPIGSEWFEPDPQLIKRICSTQYGVGSDGILLHEKTKDGGDRLRIFNPDGGEAEKSGNGIRIFAKYLLDQDLWDGALKQIDTLGGTVEIVSEGKGILAVNMGIPSFEPADVPLNDNSPWFDRGLKINEQEFQVSCLSVGNPHCVMRFDALPSDHEVREIGPMIENYPLFPNRINVQFVKVLSQDEIKMKIWERGAGFTESSGSSSSAAVAALNKLGLVGEKVQVQMPGGVLEIEIREGDIWLKGPVNKVFTGTLEQNFIERKP